MTSKEKIICAFYSTTTTIEEDSEKQSTTSSWFRHGKMKPIREHWNLQFSAFFIYCPLPKTVIIQNDHGKMKTNYHLSIMAISKQWHVDADDGEEFDRNDLYYTTQNLIQLVDSPNSLTKNLEELMKRFIFAVPGILSPATRLNLSNAKSYKKIDRSNWIENLERKFSSDKFDVLTIPRVQFSLQLPETRLIQYDCGKLQILDKLLWQLKSGRHRILIFTQMSRMLDILEQFLNYHGHTYLRLDGTTKIDQRQALMERFNADQRIFCFILSTRSGGIGVNLTGADTVIFYDSDWNPTMDAQAQDRCHRIGQTRDVHIYRLVSERTVEENILKKAKQKKMLGDLAIEEGNFTTAFFKQTAIKELFDVGEQEMNEEPTISEPVEIIETEDNSAVDSAPATPSPPTNNNSSSTIQNAAFEQALCTAEEENDVTAAKIVRAEVAAELDEFDENIPIEEIPDEKSPEEEQIEELICQVRCVLCFDQIFKYVFLSFS